jgi:hypothetical protein
MRTLTKPTKAAMTIISPKAAQAASTKEPQVLMPGTAAHLQMEREMPLYNLACDMVKQWEGQFRRIIAGFDSNGYRDMLNDILDCGEIAMDLLYDGDEMRFDLNSDEGYITFKADRIDATEWKLHAEANGVFMYDDDERETGHRRIDMAKVLETKIIFHKV